MSLYLKDNLNIIILEKIINIFNLNKFNYYKLEGNKVISQKKVAHYCDLEYENCRDLNHGIFLNKMVEFGGTTPLINSNKEYEFTLYFSPDFPKKIQIFGRSCSKEFKENIIFPLISNIIENINISEINGEIEYRGGEFEEDSDIKKLICN